MYTVEAQQRMNWFDALATFRGSNQSCVVVLIAKVDGSAPRPVGTRMVVSMDSIADTVGGGALELEAINHARALLQSKGTEPVISSRTIVLGSELSQCCGGRVELQFDCHLANDFTVHVFGAGHVAQELALIARKLPCMVTFHDSRMYWLDRLPQAAHINAVALPENVHSHVEACTPGSYYLVMTHSHELDLDVVEAILSRGDAYYCGLIASDAKANRFRNRLMRKGFTPDELLGLTAPLGRSIRTGNAPMEVAIAAMSDVLDERQRRVLDAKARRSEPLKISC